jgi:molybdopterin-binding protein
MKYGARNHLRARITEIKRGSVMCQVKLAVPAESAMCSVMTLDSLRELGVKEGDEVEVLVKAVNVLLAQE